MNSKQAMQQNNTHPFSRYRLPLKAILAGITAFVLVNILFLFYRNIPNSFASKTGATDRTQTPHFLYSKMTEGWGYGKTNNEGFNDLADFRKGETINVLIMGSSNIQADEVAESKNCTSILNKLAKGKLYAYNIGISSHGLYRTAKNLKNALAYYRPTDYVVIELPYIIFDTASLEKVNKGTFPNMALPRYTSKFELALRSLPWLYYVYWYWHMQYNAWRNGKPVAPDMDIESNRPHTTINTNYQKALNTLVSNIASTCSQYRVKPLLVYHPYLLLQNDGTVKTDTDNEYFSALQKACKAAHVKLIDMSDIFLAAYKKSHILPNGFINTHVGTGHLNTDGHRMIAEKLYAYISQGNK